MQKVLKIISWIFLSLVGVFILLVIYRVFYFFNLDKTNAQVARIHATKLTLDDVLGKNLPPDPGEEEDKTVAGIDKNNNGIRDDVEIAIFKEYPNSAKTRAPLLQYAMVLQMEFTQPVANTTVVDEVIGEQSRASSCIADSLVPRQTPESDRSDSDMRKINNFINFVEKRQLNTDIRKKVQKDFYKNLGNFANSTKKNECDIDISSLQN